MRFPSVNKIMGIGLTKEQAKAVRQRLEEGYAAAEGHGPVDSALNYADELLQQYGKTHGLEYIRHKDDGMHEVFGVDYLNTGDTYGWTLLFDHSRGTFSVGCWGDIVERAPEGTYL